MQCLKINTIAAVIMSNDSGYPVYCFSLGLWGIESRLRDLYNTSALLKEPVIHILLIMICEALSALPSVLFFFLIDK